MQPANALILINASYVVAESSVLCYIADVVHRDAAHAAELPMSVTTLIVGDEGRVDLRMQTRKWQIASARMSHGAMSGVRQGVDIIVVASREIANGSSDLSSCTELQDSWLEKATALV